MFKKEALQKGVKKRKKKIVCRERGGAINLNIHIRILYSVKNVNRYILYE